MSSTPDLHAGGRCRSRRTACLGACLLMLPLVSPATKGWAETTLLGPVTATVSVSPEQPVIGDLVTLTVEVTAEAGVEVLMPEFGEALDRFAIIDFVPKQEVAPDGKSRWQQTYRLQPAISGPQAVPPLLIEFVDRRPGERTAPEGQDAYELLTPRLDFEVESVIPETAGNELKPPLGELSLPTEQTGGWWILGGVAMGLAVAAGGLLWFYQRESVPLATSAYDAAKTRLRQLRDQPLPAQDQLDPFFVELSDIVRRYLEQRFRLRAPELTTEEFLEVAASSPDLSKRHQQTLQTFLSQADMVKFAGLKPGPRDIQGALDAAEQFIDETE
ncbi:MAG: hypothetical protein AAGF97_04260 [Planctomycetota bacterium]